MGSSSTEGRQIETIESGKTSMGDKNEKINCNYGKLYGITMYYPKITTSKISTTSDKSRYDRILRRFWLFFFAQDDHGGSA